MKQKKTGCAGRESSQYYTKKGKPLRAFVEMVQTFPVVCGDETLAKKICAKCEPRSFLPGGVISAQDSNDEGAYFVVSGDVDVRVNDSSVAKRHAKDLVGELSVMCYGAKRCASMVALTKVEALFIDQNTFVQLTKKHPKMLKLMFNVLAERLRERNDVFRIPNDPPKIFVGSSTKGRIFAHKFVDKVKELVEEEACADTVPVKDVVSDTPSRGDIRTIKVNYWDKEVFSPSGTTLNTLIEQSKDVDFAIFALTKDDLTVSEKSASRWLPRDNVIFEIGLFMGELSKERTYLVMDQADFKKLKLPSDLHGFTVAVFDKKKPASLKEKAGEIANLIRAHRSISGVIKK